MTRMVEAKEGEGQEEEQVKVADTSGNKGERGQRSKERGRNLQMVFIRDSRETPNGVRMYGEKE